MAYLYETVVDDILNRIHRGEWREGDKLPPLTKLEKTYPQSCMTLHKALHHLTDCGCLGMSQGRGTLVKTAIPRPCVGVLAGAQVFEHGIIPFALHIFRNAHAYFVRCGRRQALSARQPGSGLLRPLQWRRRFGSEA